MKKIILSLVVYTTSAMALAGPCQEGATAIISAMNSADSSIPTEISSKKSEPVYLDADDTWLTKTSFTYSRGLREVVLSFYVDQSTEAPKCTLVKSAIYLMD